MHHVRVYSVGILVLCATMAAEAATLTWDRNPEPDIISYIVSYGTQPGVHTASINVGNVTSYQFDPPAGRHYFVVQARNSAGAMSPKSAEVMFDGVAADSTKPTVSITSPVNKAVVSGAGIVVKASAADGGGIVGVRFRVDGVNIGVEDTTAPYSIAWNSTTVANGTHQLTAIARDAAGNTTVSPAILVSVKNLTTANQAPSLTRPPNQSSAQKTFASLTLVASDPERATLRFSAVGLPPGLTINSASGVISGVPTTIGSFSVTAKVSDGALSASRSFAWVVTTSAPGAVTATTVTLSPVDSTLSPDTTNYSTQNVLVTMSASNRVANASLLKFNLSQIPANAAIQSASLQMSLVAVDSVTTAPTFNVRLHRIINRNPNVSKVTGMTADGITRWTANTCCPNNAPMAQADIAASEAVAAVNRTLGIKTWDALLLVRAWHANPSRNYGLLLNPDTTVGGVRYRHFASAQHATAANRPKLRVTYVVPSTTTATTMATMSVNDETAISRTAALTEPLDETSAEEAVVVEQFTTSAADGTASGDLVTGLAPGGSIDDSEMPIRGDFDGDGRSDLATYQNATGEWRIWASGNNFAPWKPIVWGANGDLPVAADYDGDRRTDIAVFRPSTGRWHVLLSSADMQSSLELDWGDATSRPLALDHDHDGRADLVLPRSGGFDILLSSSNYTTSVTVR